MDTLIASASDNLLRSQADTLVNHLHAGIAAPNGDLLSAVRVPIQSWFANQHFQRPTERIGGLTHARSQLFQLIGYRTCNSSRCGGAADSCRCTKLAKHRTQSLRPLSGSDSHMRTADRSGHNIRATD